MFLQKSSTQQCASNSKHHVEPRVFYTTHSSDFQVGASTKHRHLAWRFGSKHCARFSRDTTQSRESEERSAPRVSVSYSIFPATETFACRQPHIILLGWSTDFAKPLAALGNPWWRSRHRVPACILLRRGLSLDIGFTMHHTHHQRHPSCALPTAGLPKGTRYTNLSLLCWSTDITSSTKTAVHRPLRNSELFSPNTHKLFKPTSLAFPNTLFEAIAPRHQRLNFFCHTQTLTPSKFKIVAMPPETDLPDLAHNHPPLSPRS